MRGWDRLGIHAGNALLEQEARIGLREPVGLGAGCAGRQQQVEAELERVLARAGMPVGGEAVGEPAAHEVGGKLLDVKPVVAEQRADVDLQQGALLEQRPQVLMAVGGALGVGEQEAEAELREAFGGGDEVLVDTRERALEQQPARAGGALGDVAELLAREQQRVVMRELAAGVQAHAEPLGADRPLGFLATGRELGERQFRIVIALDVRRAGNVTDALGMEPPGVPSVSSIVAAPSSRPGRMWQWRSTYDIRPSPR